MSVEQMRCAVAAAYKSSDSWQKKVANMSDSQIIAIYRKFLSTGKLK